MGVALGHVAGALLVAHEDVADRRLQQRVVGGQDAPAGQAEHDLDRLLLEALDEGLGSGELHGDAGSWVRRWWGRERRTPKSIDLPVGRSRAHAAGGAGALQDEYEGAEAATHR